MLDIPAPRGQIRTTRSAAGAKPAQLQSGHNFPNPMNFSMRRRSAIRGKIDEAGKLIGRRFRISNEAILRHYRRASYRPQILFNLTPQNAKIGQAAARNDGASCLRADYPNGKVASQIVGYRKNRPKSDGIVDNHETIWPQTEGREGLEQTFNDMLTGKNGRYNDLRQDGGKHRRNWLPPEPGYNVVTTLDYTCKNWPKSVGSKSKARRHGGVDPNSDVLALASWPSFDPNVFVPSSHPINSKPSSRTRTFHFTACVSFVLSTGSTFNRRRHAALNHTVYPPDQYQCVPALQIGNVTFHNWKRPIAAR
jgi:cell division protein FtsI/penicillin-binding protein 2